MLRFNSLRIIFFGTTDFAAYHLHTLTSYSIHKIIAVFTQQTKHNNKMGSISIQNIVKKNNLLLFQSNNLSITNIAHIIKKLGSIDLIIVVSYGLILTQEILNIPKLGCINVHASLLPRWRGPAPIQRALEHGDYITGITIIFMNESIDTGDIICSEICKISSTDTNYTLSNKLAHIGSITLLQTIKQIITGTYKITKQNPKYTTYAYKLQKKEARINWALSAVQIERCIRAFNPWPISFFKIKNKNIRVWGSKIDNSKNHICFKSTTPGTILITNSIGIYVKTGSGILILTVLQMPGKEKKTVHALLNGYKKLFIPYSKLE